MAAARTVEEFLKKIVHRWNYVARESGKRDGSYLLFPEGYYGNGRDINNKPIFEPHIHIGIEIKKGIKTLNLFCHFTDRKLDPKTNQIMDRKIDINMTVYPTKVGADAIIEKCKNVIIGKIGKDDLDFALPGSTGTITIIWPKAAQAAPAQAAPAHPPEPKYKYKYKCEKCETEYIWSDHGDTFMSGCMNCASKGSSSKKRFTRGDKEGKRRKSGRKSGRQSRRKLRRKSRQ